MSCFIPSNVTEIELCIKISFGVQLLSDVAGLVILSFDNPLDFHPKMLSIEPAKMFYFKEKKLKSKRNLKEFL